jgi:hypothetical protein
LQTFLDAKPQTKSVSTIEAAGNLACTQEQAEVALKAGLLVKMHDDWVPPIIVFSHHDETLAAYRLPTLNPFGDARSLFATDAGHHLLRIQEQARQIGMQQEEIRALHAKLADIEKSVNAQSQTPGKKDR